MATIREVRDTLADYLSDTCGLKCYPRVPDQVNPPALAITVGNPYIKYGITMGANLMTPGLPAPVQAPVEANLRIMIIVSRASLERAQANADEFLDLDPLSDTVSVPEAISMNPTLDGLVEWVELRQVSGYADQEIAGQPYFVSYVDVNVSISQSLGD